MTQCTLRKKQKNKNLNAAKGFPCRMTQFTETKNVTWMEIVAWIVKKQSYVCLHISHQSLARSNYMRLATLNKAGEKNKHRLHWPHC